jgi:hypothetical protein
MVVNKVVYSKEFLSQTGWNDISHHGSGNWIPYQKINDKHSKLMENIIKEFAIKSNINLYYFSQKEAEGFDGRQFYTFDFGADFPEQKEEDRENNVNYSAIVNIKKSGKLEELSKTCDLEDFLIKEGFKETKKE